MGEILERDKTEQLVQNQCMSIFWMAKKGQIKQTKEQEGQEWQQPKGFRTGNW
jgi:hypothetical protein